jgi:FlaA1/EpsC-like NDP-sugar epimerase
VINGANGGEPPTRGQRLAIAASHVRADLAFAALDVFVVVAVYTLGLAVRMLDTSIVDGGDLWLDLAKAMPAIVVVHLLANVVAGAYGHVWEHASTSEAARVVVANTAAAAVLVSANSILRLTGTELVVIPWTVFAIGGLLSLFAMGMVRFRSRLFSFHRLSGASNVLVVGTGRDAVAFARQAPILEGSRRVVGFLADEGEQAGGPRRLAGLQVLGCLDEIADVVATYGVDEVVMVGGESRKARRMVDLCLDVDVRLRLLPAAEDVLRDGVSAVDIRDIEVEDLLDRQPVDTGLASITELLRGKRVLVTGAGGSIGSEIVRQVLDFAPAEVCALDRDETLLHDGGLRWSGRARVILGDVRDPERMLRVFERFRPHVVFHAAALKHVPVLEDHPEEAVLTNVVGTRNVIEAGSRTGMERFVLISTDKAVAPSSVMGATKRVAELMSQVGTDRQDGCVYTAVRFGNVLGSRGSVIPTFIEQIKAGGPVTVTDPAMTRYFMTVDEAVQLVLQASALATGSEIFLLDMGEPVRIQDLARRLIRLAGLAPDKDIEIHFTGRRPGEKLSEMLALDPLELTLHDKIFEVRLDHPTSHVLIDKVTELEKLALEGDGPRAVELLNELAGGALLAEDPLVVIEDDSQAAVSWS